MSHTANLVSPPHLITLIGLTALSPLTLNLIVPSLPSIATDLQADYAIVSLAVAGYLGAMAVVLLVIGPLSDRLGRRPVMLGALGIFIVASIGCALAQNVWVFLACRLGQSVMSAGYAVSMAIVRDTAEPQEAAGRIGTINMAMALGPMAGPVIGGVLDAALGWRMNFVLYALVGLALLVATWFDLGETRRTPPTGQARPRIGILLQTPLFWGYAICSAFSAAGFFVFLAGAPVVARDAFGIGPAELGLYVGSITAGFLVGSAVTRRLAARCPLDRMMLLGRSVAVGGLLTGALLWTAGWQVALVLFGSTVWIGVGNGLSMPSSQTGAMSVRPDLAGSASGIVGALSVGTGAILTAVAGALLAMSPAPSSLLIMLVAVTSIGLAAAIWVAFFGARLPPGSPASAAQPPK